MVLGVGCCRRAYLALWLDLDPSRAVLRKRGMKIITPGQNETHVHANRDDVDRYEMTYRNNMELRLSGQNA